MSSSSAAVQEYEVLYYKRTNKVHKSKGVSKSDGILKVDASLQKVTLLSETAAASNAGDDNATTSKSSYLTVASSASKELVNRQLDDDDTILLGAFEVQIVSRRRSNQENAAVSKVAPKPTSLQSNTATATLRRISQPLQRKPLLARSQPKQPIKRTALVSTAAQPRKQPKTSTTIKQQQSAEYQNKAVPLLARKLPSLSDKATRKRSTPNTTSSTTAFSSSPILPHIPLPATLAQTLRPHQVIGVDFLWKALVVGDTKGAILADEMGLGKTLMTIAVIAAMHRQDRNKQFVVVCPSSLVNNWSNEFDKWIGKAGSPKRVVIKKGGEEGLAQIKAYCSKMKLNNQANQNGQVLIISYDLLRLKATDQFTSMAQTFKLLIVDEGHRLKNTAGSLTLTALESIPCDARLCVTATPIQNNLSEFYTLANFCRPGCLGDLQSFRRDFERPISASSGSNASQEQRRLGAVQAKELDKITQTFMLRRLQKDILSTMLPPRSEFLLFCIPSIEQCELYRSIVNESQGESAESLTKLTALRKLCLHPCLLDQTTVSHANADIAQSGKLVVLEALLVMIRTQCPHDKVVLVSSYTSALTVVESVVLQPRQLSYVRLDGTTDVQSRQPLVDSFNRSSPDQQFCLLLSSKAGGVGLNLVGANRLIMLDADWNPAFCIQAMGRIYRQGQTKSTFIYRFFTSGTIEEVIYQRQSAKGNLADMAVDGKTASSTKGFTKEELADCFTLKDGCPCDTKRKLGSRWPDYTGTESLDASDTVLIELGKQMKESIGHVHVVKDEELALAVDSLDTESPHQESLYDTDTDDDEELEFE